MGQHSSAVSRAKHVQHLSLCLFCILSYTERTMTNPFSNPALGQLPSEYDVEASPYRRLDNRDLKDEDNLGGMPPGYPYTTALGIFLFVIEYLTAMCRVFMEFDVFNVAYRGA